MTTRVHRVLKGLLTLTCLAVALPPTAPAATAGTLTTVAGGLPTGAPASVPLNPMAVTTGPDGTLYIADGARDVVQKVSLTGEMRPVAGSGVTGLFGDGGPATHAALASIQRVALDSRENLLISGVDALRSQNALVRVVAAADCAAGSCPFGFKDAMTKGFIYTVAGRPGGTGAPVDGALATSTTLKVPQGMAVNSRGDLLIADSALGAVYVVAASDCETCPYGRTQWEKGHIYRAVVGLGGPTALVLTARGDILTANQTAGELTMVAASDCAAGTCPWVGGELFAGQIVTIATGSGAVGLAMNQRGDLVFGRGNAPDIAVLAASDCAAGSCPFGFAGAMTKGQVTVVAGTSGTAGIAADGTPALTAPINRPNEVAVGAGGELLIAMPIFGPQDGEQVSMVAPSTCSPGSCPYGYPGAMTKGAIYRFAGLGTYRGFVGEGMPAAGAFVVAPFGVAVGARGDVLFTYFTANLVRMAAGGDCTAGSCPFGFPGAMTKGHMYTVAGKLDNPGFSPDGTDATEARLRAPSGVAVTGRGDLVFAQATNDVVQVVASADCAAGTCPFGFAGAMTRGKIYTVAGTSVSGTPVDGTPATAADLDLPTGVAIGPGGDLVIASYLNNSVEVVAASDCAAGSCPFGFPGAMTKGRIYAVAGTPGTPGFAPDGTQAAGGALGGPQAVAVDGAGNLLIADPASHVVRMVAAADCAAGSCPYGLPTAMTKGTISTVAGTPGFGGASPNGTPARTAAIGGPTGLAVTARGDLLISDDSGRVVWALAGADCAARTCPFGFPNPMVRGGIYALAGTPLVQGFSPDGTAASSAKLGAAQGVALDADGNLFMADSGNGRILRLGREALPPLPPPDPGGNDPGTGPTGPSGPDPGTDPGGPDPGTGSPGSPGSGGSGPGAPGTPGSPGTGTADRTAPLISALTLTKRTFAVVKSRRRTPLGTTVRFRLSEAATVTFSVQKRVAGRRSGKRCVVSTRKLVKAKAKKCTLTTTLGSFTRKLAAGTASVAFTGTPGRVIKPGSYVLSLAATDAAGNRGAARTTPFKVVR